MVHIIKGGGQPIAGSARAGEAEEWQCRQCKARTGVATRQCIEVYEPNIKKGKVSKGTKRLICLQCKMNNVTTYLN